MKKLLIVDDIADNISLLKMFLTEGVPSISIDSATSIEHGLDLLENNRYDLVITDVSFDETKSNCDGIYIAKKAGELFIPTIVVSSIFEKEEIEAQFVKIGVEKILLRRKDKFISELVDAVKELIHD